MYERFRYSAVLFLIIISSALVQQASSQGTNTDFFQNRLQFRGIKWSYLSSENIDVFYHGRDRLNAEIALRNATQDIEDIENTIGYRLSGRIYILLFHQANDFRQSNLLINDPQFNSGGYTYIAQNRLIVYFNGNHADLKKQIRYGLAEVLIKEMIYGGSMQERIQNSIITFPPWFTRGLYSYLSVDWNTSMDNMFRDGILSSKYGNLNNLDEESQVLAGHALWRYVAEKYGKGSIANILYVSRVSRSHDNGFPYTIGIELSELLAEWKSFYEEYYKADDQSRFMPGSPENIDDKLALKTHTALRISPDGKQVVFVTNNRGACKVWLYNRNTREKKILFRSGYKTEALFTDYDYPLVCWLSPKEIVLVHHRRVYPELVLMKTDGTVKKRYTLKNYDKVNSIDAGLIEKSLLLSMVKYGQTDLYLYYPSTDRFEQLTKSIWDETDARFIASDSLIVFASNQPVDTASTGFNPNHDLFIMPVSGDQNDIKRLTNTALVNEHLPVPYQGSYISFLSDKNGIVNSFALDISKPAAEPFPVTNYKRSIITQDVAMEKAQLSELIFDGNRYRIYFSDIEGDIKATAGNIKLEPTQYRKSIDDTSAIRRPLLPVPIKTIKPDSTLEKAEPDPDTGQDSATFFLQSEYDQLVFEKDTVPSVFMKTADDKENEPSFKYKLTFTPDYLVTQLDNSVLGTYYIPYNFEQRAFNTQWLNILGKISLSDMFGDYNVTGGVRIPGTFDGSDWFISATSLKKRVDKTLSYFRQARRQQNSIGEYNRYTIQETRFSMKYPLSNRDAVRLGIFIRQDRATILGTDQFTLLAEDHVKNWTGYKLEYIYDNTISLGMNLHSGLRFKLFNEMYHRIGTTSINLLNWGLDVRYYHRIKRGFIWANRLAANTSVANRKILYYIGGVENWINPQFFPLPLANNDRNEYMAVVTNVRGFPQNIRNGNSYVVLNSELRFPLFAYFSPHPVKSEFFKHFLLVGFFDAGTAWTGSSPYSANNPYNTKVIENGSTTITVVYHANPYVYGFGGGARGKVFGYYLKYDAAWGVIDNNIGKVMHYISLSMDF